MLPPRAIRSSRHLDGLVWIPGLDQRRVREGGAPNLLNNIREHVIVTHTRARISVVAEDALDIVDLHRVSLHARRGASPLFRSLPRNRLRRRSRHSNGDYVAQALLRQSP